MNTPNPRRLRRRSSAAAAGALVVCLTFVAGGCASAPRPEASPSPADVASAPATGSPPGSSVLDGVFTASQASRGEWTFGRTCASCHETSEFGGPRFRIRWAGQTVGDMFYLVFNTMPEGSPGSLSPDEYAEVLAYILHLNGYPTGEERLPTDDSALRRIRIERAPVGL